MASVRSVLIVDDNSSLAYFSACNLRGQIEGLTVFIAGSCEEAAALAEEHHPCVLIADLRLPDGDGRTLIDELTDRYPDMFPILITATPLSADSHSDLFGVLTKPYDIDRLIDLVRDALNSGHWPHPPAGERSHSAELVQKATHYDFHRIQNRLSALLAGIRALRLELYAVAEDPTEVRRTIDEYTDRLCAIVKDAGETLKRGADNR